MRVAGARGTLCPMQGTIEVGAAERGAVALGAVVVFVRVAELQSFRGAADALGVPRSTVSRRISELERALGTRLLQRTTRRVELTSAGKTYLGACSPALGTILEAGRALSTSSEETAGRLRVTAPVTLGEGFLGDVVAECLARHPQMSIELVLTDLAGGAGRGEVRPRVPRRHGEGHLPRGARAGARPAALLCGARIPARPRYAAHATRPARHDCILFTPLGPRDAGRSFLAVARSRSRCADAWS